MNDAILTYTSLSLKGYSIKKNELSEKCLSNIKSQLTVSPNDLISFNSNSQQKRSFSLYLESNSKIYLPKAYGLKLFGKPMYDKLPKGDKIRDTVEFKGTLRKEQEKPVESILTACNNEIGGGILNVYCGGGKTTMSLYVLTKLGLKTMIVVHKDFLLNQWKERIAEFLPNAKIGLIKAQTINTDGDIVLASLQSLCMKEYDPQIFESFGTLITDECHHTSAEVFSKALQKVSFRYTIGLTATITRKDGLSKVFKWYLGDVIHKATKRIDTVLIHIYKYYDPAPVYSQEHMIYSLNKPNMAKMVNNICSFKPRQEFILNLIKDIFNKEPDRKMLILSDRRCHLTTLHRQLLDIGYDTGIYMGGMKQDALEQCSTKKIILATFAIASEGYDQKGLDTLILASPKGDVIQSVGRILRDKEHERKHVPLVIDIVDNFSIFVNQGQKRKKYYDKMNYEVVEINN